MNGTMAIMTREVVARRELLLLALALAIVVSFLPYLPNIETYEATDVRIAASSTTALAIGCLLALVLGATVFGNDLSEGRLGFFFARPVSGFAIWWGRVLALIGLIWVIEGIVLLPSFYSGGAYIFSAANDIGWPARFAFIVGPLLLFLLAHAASIMVRAGTLWLFLDLGGALVVAVLAWLNLRPLYEIGAPIALWVVAGALVAASLISLAVGGASGVAVGRVDLKRVHGAQSLAMWSTMAICIAATTVYSSWLRDFGPREFNEVDVITVAPDGLWVEVIGRAKGRLDVKRRYLMSTDANRWVPLPARRWLPQTARWEFLDVVRAYSFDGSTAVWRGGGVGDEPRSLWWADLGRPDPMARPTNIVVPFEAALTLAADGSRLAILEEGIVSVYELGEERLLKAIRLPEDFQRAAIVFLSPNTMRLFAEVGNGDDRSLRLAEIDVASGELARSGEIPVTGDNDSCWFSVDADLEHLVVSTRSEHSLVWKKAIYDAKNGGYLRDLDVEGFPKFLQDGRMMFASEAEDGSITLTVETVDGDGRLVHTVRPAFGSRIIGEAVPNGVIVAHLADPGDRTKGIRLALFDLETGEIRNIGSQVRGRARGFWWQSGFNMTFIWHRNHCAVSRLFIDQSGALVRWDPESGEMVHVVGGRD
jgi:hypothetical protein